MPALSYPTGNFQPFTKILSSEMNGKLNAITTWANVTKLDYQNLQTGNLLYASQLSMQVIVTNATGLMTTTQTLPVLNGGLGFSPAITTLDISKVVQVNQAGTALTLDTVPSDVGGKIFNFYRFG